MERERTKRNTWEDGKTRKWQTVVNFTGEVERAKKFGVGEG